MEQVQSSHIVSRRIGNARVIAFDSTRQETWRTTLFHGYQNQYRTTYIVGNQGQGKSTVILNMIKLLSNKKRTQIYWLSSVGRKDQKVAALEDDYYIQFFDQENINKGILQQIYKFLENKIIQEQKDANEQYEEMNVLEDKQELYMHEEEERKHKEKKPKKQFIENWIVMDDIILNKSDQQHLAIILKTYRHLKCSVITSTQDFVHQNMKSLRNMYNVQILFSQLPRDRLKESVYPQLRTDITFEEFLEIYNAATKKPFHFLLIDNREKTVFQEGFNNVLEFK